MVKVSGEILILRDKDIKVRIHWDTIRQANKVNKARGKHSDFLSYLQRRFNMAYEDAGVVIIRERRFHRVDGL